MKRSAVIRRKRPARPPDEPPAGSQPAPPPLGADPKHVLRLLEQEGCPVCADSADHDGAYFFWFFNEHYYEAHTIDALTQSLGFCRRHGELLAARTAGGSQLRYVHEMLVRRVRVALAAAPPKSGKPAPPHPAISRPCPACRSRRDGEERTTFWLDQVLRQAGIERYGNPGMVCYPHLQDLAPRLPEQVWLRVLSIHRDAMLRRLVSLPVDDHETLPSLLSTPDGRRSVLHPALKLSVGHPTNRELYPSLSRPDALAPPRDPVTALLDSLRGSACPICLETRRAWLEWASWLEDSVDEADRLGDILPTCPDHVWTLVYYGSPILAFAATRRALGAWLDEVATAIPRPPAPPRTLWDRLDERWWGARRRVAASREVIARGIRCPACHRLAVGEERATALLFALLEGRAGRRAFEEGYGLCVKHLVPALGTAPRPEIREILVRVHRARMATLEWELVEAGRKAAWQFRPEAKDAEENAWYRALLRFSGSLRPRWN